MKKKRNRRTNSMIKEFYTHLSGSILDAYINNTEITMEDISELYIQQGYSVTNRAMQRDLAIVGIKFHHGTYQLTAINSLKKQFEEISELLDSLDLYKPLRMSNIETFNDKKKFPQAKTLHFYRIVMDLSDDTQNKELLRRLHHTIYRYLEFSNSTLLNSIYNYDISPTRITYEVSDSADFSRFYILMYRLKFHNPTSSDETWIEYVLKNKNSLLKIVDHNIGPYNAKDS